MKPKPTVRQMAVKRLERIMSDLEAAGDYFEDRGFETQADVLDSAATRVESVMDSLASL